MTSPINKHLHLDPPHGFVSPICQSKAQPVRPTSQCMRGIKVVCLLTGASVPIIPWLYRGIDFPRKEMTHMYDTKDQLTLNNANELLRLAKLAEQGKRDPKELIWDIQEVANKIIQTIEER